MPLFKKRSSPQPAQSASYVGRKLHSDLDIDACIANLRAGLAAHGIPAGDDLLFEADWVGSASKPTATVVGTWLDRPRPTPPPPRAIYLAVWPDGDYDEGTYQEMALVPDGWSSNDPLPYIGHWKQSDPSLSSIGSVSGATFKVEPRL